MRYFRYGLFIPIFLLIVSCITPPAPPVKKVEEKETVVRPPRPDSYYDRRNERDEDRREVIDRYKRERKGPTCEGDDDCEDICKDIYSRRSEREECEELSVSQVEDLEKIHEILEDPDFEDLEEISLDDLEAYINIDIRPLHSLSARYSPREAKEMLTWIAADEDVAKLFEKEDDDYTVLENLLNELVDTNKVVDTNKGFAALMENIDGSDNFMDVAVLAGNEIALEWIDEYLEDEDGGDCDGNLETTDCLTAYCKLARSMDEDNAYDLLGFEYFEEYLEDIIDGGINKCTSTDPPEGCWDGDFDRVDDLNKWWEDLCPEE